MFDGYLEVDHRQNQPFNFSSVCRLQVSLAQYLHYCCLLHYHSLCRSVIIFGVLLGKRPLVQGCNIWNQYSCAGYLWDQGARRLWAGVEGVGEGLG